MAPLGLIHVMRRDQERQSLRSEAMNLLPKIAPGFRIDTRGRFVE
jgi:hypothetical protein